MVNVTVIQDGKGKNAVCGMMNVKCLIVMDMDIATMENAPVFMGSKANFVTKVRLLKCYKHSSPLDLHL